MYGVEIIELPKVEDRRGSLTFYENMQQIPFRIQRIFWTYDVPGGETRGGHAYFTQQEFIVALSGSFDVVVTHHSGRQERFHLNRSYYGLFLPAKTWRHLENFSTNSLSIHASDQIYSEEDYIRNFEAYKRLYV